MKYTASIGLALAMSSSLVQGAFQYNLYSDKSCQNFMGSFKGDSGGNYNGVTQDYDPGMVRFQRSLRHSQFFKGGLSDFNVLVCGFRRPRRGR